MKCPDIDPQAARMDQVKEATNVPKPEDSNALYAMDVLDLDEEVIDEKLERILNKDEWSDSHFGAVLLFIQYKRMISEREETGCENDSLIDFTLQRLMKLNDHRSERFNLLLRILNCSIELDSDKIVFFAELILQQMFASINSEENEGSDDRLSLDLMYLHIIDNMINLCMRHGCKPDYNFLSCEIIGLLRNPDHRLFKETVSIAVPNIVLYYEDHDLLNIIWDRIGDKSDDITADEILSLCTLSDFYFPVEKQTNGCKIQSYLIADLKFWKLVQNGLNNADSTVRKCCNYLIKRAIAHCKENHSKIIVQDDVDGLPYFEYNSDDVKTFDGVWTNFFTIIESLDEKQFSLIESALNLLPTIVLHPSWYNCIIRRALSHDTDTVISKALTVALEIDVPNQYSSFPYRELIQAMSRLYLYENFFDADRNNLPALFGSFINRPKNLSALLQCMKDVMIPPLPRFFISYMFLKNTSVEMDTEVENFQNAFFEALPFNCNNMLIEYGTQCCVTTFCVRNYDCTDVHTLSRIFTHNSNLSIIRHDNLWHEITNSIRYRQNDIKIRENILDIHSDALTHGIRDRTLLMPFVKLLFAHFDSIELHLDLLEFFVLSELNKLDDCSKHTYRTEDYYDASFFFIVTIVRLHEETSKAITVVHDDSMEHFFKILNKHSNGIVSFMKFRLGNLETADNELIDELFEGFQSLLRLQSTSESLLDQLPSVVTLAHLTLDDSGVNVMKRYFALKIICCIGANMPDGDERYVNLYYEGLDDEYFLNSDHSESGSFVSAYNHTICRIKFAHYSKMNTWSTEQILMIYDYILEALEKGGSECLLWPVKFAKFAIKFMSAERMWDKITFLLSRMWKEVLQVRKNHQFRDCIEEFIKIVFDADLLNESTMRDLALDYANKLFELGELAPFTIYLLINHFKTELKSTNLTPLVPILIRAFLTGFAPRKDQRIEYEVCNYIETNAFFTTGHLKKQFSNSYERIKTSVLDIIMHQSEEFHIKLCEELRNEITIMCKSKQRYHANSSIHRTLLRGLQMLVLMFKVDGRKPENIEWSIDILNNQPHHASIKLFLEWYIALHLIYNERNLKESVNLYRLDQLPLVSLFMVLYHVIRHQLYVRRNGFKDDSYVFNRSESLQSPRMTTINENFDYAMTTYLPYTMGQLFNLRLYAQYLFAQLYQSTDSEVKDKFTLVNETVKRNFKLSSDEKNLKKIQADFYVNDFDIVANLNVCDVFHHIPRLMDLAEDEWMKLESADVLDKAIFHTFVESKTSSEFHMLYESNLSNLGRCSSVKSVDDVVNETTVIQKKFIPWKNMITDIGLQKKTSHCSDLIVVASLIDRIPNLGGLARTCEIFGVKRYVIGSLRYVQDKQFQSLSVSSERWIDIEEIRPIDLKGYLIRMKETGYSVICAEQTSSSLPLNEIKFPKKTVLLLGNEKDGVPADLLHIVDLCVEIPQRGVIRSLNVHVTASIFIWEYNQQF